MLIRETQWEAIRGQFSEEEKIELRKYVTGEAICPRGFCVDVESIPEPLRTKLTTALQGAK
jgi:hypothetical protein